MSKSSKGLMGRRKTVNVIRPFAAAMLPDGTGPVRTLDDMTPEERAAIEKLYGAKILPPRPTPPEPES